MPCLTCCSHPWARCLTPTCSVFNASFTVALIESVFGLFLQLVQSLGNRGNQPIFEASHSPFAMNVYPTCFRLTALWTWGHHGEGKNPWKKAEEVCWHLQPVIRKMQLQNQDLATERSEKQSSWGVGAVIIGGWWVCLCSQNLVTKPQIESN